MCIFWHNHLAQLLIRLLQLPSSPSSGSDSFGPEQIRQFTFDYTYWSADSADPQNCSQEKVFFTVITFAKCKFVRCLEFCSSLSICLDSQQDFSKVLDFEKTLRISY